MEPNLTTRLAITFGWSKFKTQGLGLGEGWISGWRLWGSQVANEKFLKMLLKNVFILGVFSFCDHFNGSSLNSVTLFFALYKIKKVLLNFLHVYKGTRICMWTSFFINFTCKTIRSHVLCLVLTVCQNFLKSSILCVRFIRKWFLNPCT